MEPKTDFFIKNIKIHLPVDLIKKSLTYDCNNDTEVTKWKLGMSENSTEAEQCATVKLSTCKENGYLTVQIDCMRLVLLDSFYTCKFYIIEDKPQSNHTASENSRLVFSKAHFSSPSCSDAGTQTDASNSNTELETKKMPQKRKRGRPRVLDKNKETKQKLENNIQTVERISESRPETTAIDTVNDITKDLQPHLSTDIISITEYQTNKKYQLRGVRLNKQLMNAEKGLSDDEEDTLGRNSLEETENFDKEFIPENEDNLNNSDDEDEHMKARHRIPLDENHRNNSSNKLAEISRPKAKRRKKKPGVLACRICNKLLCDFTGVYNHVLRKHSRRKKVDEYLEELKVLMIVKCPICDVECRDSLKLRQHMKIQHQDVEPRTCSYCQKSFKNSHSLKTHIRSMHILEQEKTNICHLCTAAFKTLSNLKQHIKQTHVRKKDFACNICSKTFCTKAQVTRHARIHGVDESKRVHCKECGKSFLFEFNLRRHLENVHSKHSEKYHCSYCGKGFGNKIGMITHVQTVHFNLFAYPCKECSASFSKSSFLKKHMVTSHGRIDFKMPELPSKNGIYDRTTENMFYCSYCSSGFNHKAKLIEHMHSDHSDAFPYKCSTCNQGFLEKSFLTVHNLRAHDIIPFESDTDENQPVKTTEGSADIFQFITTKCGATGKIVAIQSEQGSNQTVFDDFSLQNHEIKTEQPMDSSTVYVQVADGSTTRQFMVQAPEGMMTNKAIVQDLSSILIQAAGQTLQTDGITTDVQEINLVIQNPSEVGSDITEVTETIVMTEDGQEFIAEPQTVYTDYNVISAEVITDGMVKTAVIQDGSSEIDNTAINTVI